MIENALREGVPCLFINWQIGSKFADGFSQVRSEAVIGLVTASERDDGKPLRQKSLRRKAVQCRNQLSTGKVARRTEEDQSARRRFYNVRFVASIGGGHTS